jgi:hypothetical protein
MKQARAERESRGREDVMVWARSGAGKRERDEIGYF